MMLCVLTGSQAGTACWVNFPHVWCWVHWCNQIVGTKVLLMHGKEFAGGMLWGWQQAWKCGPLTLSRCWMGEVRAVEGTLQIHNLMCAGEVTLPCHKYVVATSLLFSWFQEGWCFFTRFDLCHAGSAESCPPSRHSTHLPLQSSSPSCWVCLGMFALI